MVPVWSIPQRNDDREGKEPQHLACFRERDETGLDEGKEGE